MTDLTPQEKLYAIQLGQLVNVAYAMFDKNHNDLKPPPVGLPKKYKFIAWVQMADFFFEKDTFRYYGLIVQRVDQPNNFIMAIRGTVTGMEWWDNLKSAQAIPLQGFGNVAEGFELIFKTMRVVKANGSLTDEFGSGMGFAEQVAVAVKAASTTSQTAAAPVPSIEVVGHSLGSALATLYVAKNENAPQRLNISRLCTFASPRIGDATFAAEFDKLKLVSWRIADEVDVVTLLPPGFAHVAQGFEYPPGDVAPNAPCVHRMSSYFHILDPQGFPADWDCDNNAQHGPGWA